MIEVYALFRDVLDNRGGVSSFQIHKEIPHIHSPHDTMWDVEQKGNDLIKSILDDENREDEGYDDPSPISEDPGSHYGDEHRPDDYYHK